MLLFCWDSACVNGSSPSLNSKPKLGFDEMLGCWTKHTIYRFWRGEIRWGLPNKNVAIPLFQILPFPLQYSGKLPVCFKACCNQHSCYGTRHTAEACAWLTQYFRLELHIFFVFVSLRASEVLLLNVLPFPRDNMSEDPNLPASIHAFS